VVTTYDISQYTGGAVQGDDDIIELACALVQINRLHEIGEIAFSSDQMFEIGQLSLIKRILQSSTTENNHAWMKLYKRLQELRG